MKPSYFVYSFLSLGYALSFSALAGNVPEAPIASIQLEANFNDGQGITQYSYGSADSNGSVSVNGIRYGYSYRPGKDFDVIVSQTVSTAVFSYDKPFVQASILGESPISGQAYGNSIVSLQYSTVLVSNQVDTNFSVRVYPEAFLDVSGAANIVNGESFTAMGRSTVSIFDITSGQYVFSASVQKNLAQNRSEEIASGSFSPFTISMRANKEYLINMYSTASFFAKGGGYAKAIAYADPYFELIDAVGGDAAFVFSPGITNQAPTQAIPEPSMLMMAAIGVLFLGVRKGLYKPKLPGHALGADLIA